MKYTIEIDVRDGENGNAPAQRITITLDSNRVFDSIEEYAAECAYHAAGCFGHVDPIVTWLIYGNDVLLRTRKWTLLPTH